MANLTAIAVAEQQWQKATDLFSEVENTIARTTDNVDVYNILVHNAPPFPKKFLGRGSLDRLYATHVGRLQEDPLSTLMNGPIREKLGIIPDNVIWGGQSGNVFKYQSIDFMKPVIDDVTKLLNYGLKVVVYQGQLDMICDTPGAEIWIGKLDWYGIREFQATSRKPLYPPSAVKTRNTGAFVKSYKNLELYYIMKAGHMVPLDNGEMAQEMVRRILSGQ